MKRLTVFVLLLCLLHTTAVGETMVSAHRVSSPTT